MNIKPDAIHSLLFLIDSHCKIMGFIPEDYLLSENATPEQIDYIKTKGMVQWEMIEGRRVLLITRYGKYVLEATKPIFVAAVRIDNQADPPDPDS